MQVTFFPVQLIDVAPAKRKRRDALLNRIERRYYNFIPPGETNDDGMTHEEQQQLIRKDEAALAKLKVRETPAAPKNEALEEHVTFYSWLIDSELLPPIMDVLPCPDAASMFALATTLERELVQRVLPVDESDASRVQATVELIDALRDWAARDLSFGMYVG